MGNASYAKHSWQIKNDGGVPDIGNYEWGGRVEGGTANQDGDGRKKEGDHRLCSN